MHTSRIVSAAVLSLLVCPVTGHAQMSDGGRGLWVSLGLGGGATTSDEFTGSEHFGGSFYGRIGGTLSARVLIGTEFIVWGRSQGDLSPARGNLTLTALFQPSEDGVLFLKAGGGLAVAALLREHMGGVTTRGATGVGATGGLGAHVRLGRSVFLTPNFDVLFQHFPPGDDPSRTNFVFLFNLGLTFR